jgi:CheY-like chemotaxis protein
MEKAMMARSSAAQILEKKDWTALAAGKLEVLIVEDDEADAFLIHKALRRNPKISRIMRARDGLEALDLLERELVKPDIVIIDLHMPRKDGQSLLIELRCRPDWDFPTIVLTSSQAREDATRARLRGANVFLTKPDTIEELDVMLTDAIKAI